MRKLFIIMTALLVLPLSIAVAGCGRSAESETAEGTAPAGDVPADTTWEVQGFSFPAWWHDAYLGAETLGSLDRMAATGANWVAIIPTQYMADASSNTIVPETDGRTVSDASVIHIITEAHERGLKVMLKPHVDVQTDVWRGDIQPDDPAAWFDSYETMITGYARVAEELDVELFCVGTEFVTMEADEYLDEWSGIIASVRYVYGGELTYTASINSYESTGFWGELDYLGLSFYYPLSDAADPSLEELVAGWTGYSGYYATGADWLAKLEAWQQWWGKPVILTEIGYRSIDYTAKKPWDYGSAGVYNGEAQARAYEAAWQVLQDEPWLAGMFWWNWGVKADTCGPGNTDYSVCGKPAETTVTDIFSGTAGPVSD